ncbi:hypothetical protein D018_4662B, partial [Vibrio parahaemolyticus VP2007-007]
NNNRTMSHYRFQHAFVTSGHAIKDMVNFLLKLAWLLVRFQHLRTHHW